MVTVVGYGHEIGFDKLKSLLPEVVMDAYSYVISDMSDSVIKQSILRSYYIITPCGNREIDFNTSINTNGVRFIEFGISYSRLGFGNLSRSQIVPRNIEIMIKFNDGSSIFYRMTLPENTSDFTTAIKFPASVVQRSILYYLQTGCHLIMLRDVYDRSPNNSFDIKESNILTNLPILQELQHDADSDKYASVLSNWISVVGIDAAINACQKYGYMELLMVIMRYTKDSEKADTLFRL